MHRQCGYITEVDCKVILLWNCYLGPGKLAVSERLPCTAAIMHKQVTLC